MGVGILRQRNGVVYCRNLKLLRCWCVRRVCGAILSLNAGSSEVLLLGRAHRQSFDSFIFSSLHEGLVIRLPQTSSSISLVDRMPQ